ncbi:Uu.00g111680.m01.CDS01 [Anthostomella pinea]|uniref:holo-[acyl-carrier-protein] synthase n=1 Tax=Anthostomella pinea TaxID=933095 RepID=A0AAI8VG38_9PEZI|nr:Uu.00g111680.m01.CDS01 [Anthostomella pinea]
MGSDKVEVIQYLVDTRKLWPQATKTNQLEHEASRALALLTEEERAGVLRFYFVADAKMSLASHLLKHWVVSRYCGIPWRDTKLTRDAHGKPIFVDAATGQQPVAFNVSHQAGLVALVAVHGYEAGKVDAGVDIVCTSERQDRDRRMVRVEGWAKFVDMHAEVFGASEAAYLKKDLLASSASASQPGPDLPPLAREEDMVDFKLRGFYTLWCLREAYVKMTGEALLAEWLRDLNFRGFRAPEPGDADSFVQASDEEEPAQVIRVHDVLFKGRKVDDANICLRALGPDYMTCTAVRTPGRKEDGLGWELGPFAFLALERILDDAEGASG